MFYILFGYYYTQHVRVPKYNPANRYVKARDKRRVDINFGVPPARISHIIRTSCKEELIETCKHNALRLVFAGLIH